MSWRDRLGDDDPFRKDPAAAAAAAAAEAAEEAERRRRREQAEADARDARLAAQAAEIDRLRVRAMAERTAPKPARPRSSIWVWPFRRKGGYSSTRAAGVLYLAAAEPSLGVRGVLLGKELMSGTGVVYDPFTQYGDELSSGNMLVLGELGPGKSASVKCYAMRQLTFGRQVAVLDSKSLKRRPVGEWVPVAEALGFTPVTFGGAAGVRINPLDPRIAARSKATGGGGRVGQDAILRAVGEVAVERKLTSTERRMLRAAHSRVRRITGGDERPPAGCPFRSGDEPTLPMVAWALLNPADADVKQAKLTAAKAIDAGRLLADGLDELCSGDLAGLVDGPTTASLDLDQPLLVFDVSQVDADSAALPVLMAVIGVFLQAVWVRPDDVKRILVIEEGWHLIGHLGTARLLRRLMKFSRSLGVQVVTILHRLSDLRTGDPELAALVASLLKESATRMVFRQHWTEKAEVGDTFGLPPHVAAELDRMGRGHCWFQVGRRVKRLHIRRSELEEQLTNTDEAYEEAA